MSNPLVEIKLLTSTAKILLNAPDSIGYDIFADEDCVIPGFVDIIQNYHNSILVYNTVKEFNSNRKFNFDVRNWKKVSTGISMACDLELGEFILDKSSLADCGITVMGGVVEGTYRKEIFVVLGNIGPFAYKVVKGKKIAQFVFKKVVCPILKVVDEFSIPETKRIGGFGSTGDK